jgi:glycosyltransferase involved in cell wall biosynthesis
MQEVVLMFAVIPAWNEASRIGRAIQTVYRAGCKQIIVVANGCTDQTEQVVLDLKARFPSLQLISFPFRLGVDVPRAIGAKVALGQGARHILFYDGDLIGQIEDSLASLLHTASAFDLDLALCDCYGVHHSRNDDDLLLTFRGKISQEMGVFRKIGYSNPAHGPSVISARFLKNISISDLAQPPVILTLAKIQGMHIDSPIHIPHSRLGSAFKDKEHTKKIRDTIIGDCIEALQVLKGLPRTRSFAGHTFDGYHSERRFDVIEKFKP